ncbi:Hsp70 family protein [Francisella tularensis]|uniref:Hsp70 family protein n=1 Tax=Francisella tularensis TaxID=263 RepID=UPI0016818F6C|nr:Hsp70 family protein [Francisella tularensis]MBD2809103.1 Hsp70 family protein [Francisella tularensis]
MSEAFVSDRVIRALESFKKPLVDSGLSMDDISEVIIRCGPTRMPLLQEKVNEFLYKEPCKDVNY